MKSFLLFFLFLFFLNNQSLFSQAGAIDPTFNPTDVGYAKEYGADGTVRATVIQNDGRIIIGGEFYKYDGLSRHGIARLNPDGLLDASFNPGAGVSGSNNNYYTTVYAIAIQTDGKIIVGGNFTDYDGTSRNSIARLNSNGSLDASFNPGTGMSGGDYPSVYAIAVQTDGKIIVGGSFTDYNGTPRNNIIRLNSDGSLDASFNSGTGLGGAYNTVYAIAEQTDGKIIIGGYFADYNGTARNNIARLNSDGNLDASFNAGSGADGDVRSMVIQPDGKIIIAGNFWDYNGIERHGIARLNTDGALDNSFDAGDAVEDNNVYAVALQNDGSIIVGGGLQSYFYGAVQDLLVHLNSNGTKDPNFYPPWLAEPTFSRPEPGNTYCLAIQSNGQILVGGTFYWGPSEINIHRLNYNGTPDASFDVSTGANNYVASIVMQPDKKILISGGFTAFNGIQEGQAARLNTDGTPDESFHVNDTLYVADISLQNDGKIIAGTYYYGVKRFNTNGRIDSSFLQGVRYGEVYKTVIQNDGKILVGGSDINLSPPFILSSFLRLNEDGTVDPAFYSTATQNNMVHNAVYDIAVQPDNKIVVAGGGWPDASGSTFWGILRLNNDGSRDVSFQTGTVADGNIWKVAIQNDGKILVGGSFTIFNGNNKKFLARLNADGSLDNSFNPGQGPDSTVSAIAFQNDGKILIGGDFTSYNGVSRNKIARLNSDGALDNSFNPGNGANGSINAIAIQTDGKILIGGNFTAYNGTGRNRIARLMGIGSTAAYVSIAITSGTYPTCPGQSITFTASPTNGGSSPTYQWKVNGNNVGSNSPTYTTNTLTGGQVVSCVMTSNLANADPSTATSNSITIASPPAPIASIALTSGTNPSCAGQSLTFTATQANGGTNPSYQWKVNGNNVGTNSPIYITNTLTNGQVVTCTMTSSIVCTRPVTSNPIAITINSCSPSSQPPDWAWAKKSACSKDDYGECMAKDKNDNLFVAGRFGDSIQFGNITLHAPGVGMYVVKYDASGNVIWARSNAGNASAVALCIAADQSGNVYVAGEFNSTSIKFGNITLSRTDNGYWDAYLVKFDAAGNAVWAKSGIGDRWNTPWGLAVDNSGNVYMTGDFLSTSVNFSGTILDNATPWNYHDMFIVKYNSAGNVLWAKRAESYSFATYVNGIAVDNTGNIYVTGSFKGDYNYGDSLKFGNFTLYNHSGGDAPNYFIVKYDPSGNVLWANGANNFLGRSSGNGISTDKWGNVYVVGDFSYNNIRFGNSVVAYQGNQDIFITKYDPSGNVKWAKGVGSPGYDYSGAITADNDGNVYTGGFFANNNINIGGTIYNNAGPDGTGDILVVKCDSTGNFLWTKTTGGNNGDGVAGIVTDANKNVYISGSFYSVSVPFGCTTLFNSDSTGTTSDFYIAKLGTADANTMPAVSIALTSGTNSICQGQSVTFTATPTNGGTNPIYQWKVNGNNAGTNSPTYTTNTLTNGQVVTCIMTLTSTPACANLVTVTSNSISISINPAVAPAITISQTSCNGNTIGFTANITNGGTNPSYLWSFTGTGTATNFTGSNFTLNNAANGTQVKCRLTANATCANLVQVTSTPLTVTCVAPGFVSPANLDLKVYPNPANQNAMITFYLGASVRISLDVFDMAGQQIEIIEDKVMSSGNQSLPLNTNKLAAGVYFVRLRTINYETAKKLVVVH